MSKKVNNDGKLLEEVVAEMCTSINDAKVKHNAKVKGKLTKTQRQIDVLVKGKYGFVDVMIEVEAKDYKRPVSITQVESFISKIKDTGADLGVMVCSKGFTSGAKASAVANNIQLFEVFSGKLKNTPFLIPIRMIIPEIKSYAVGFKHSTHGPFSMPSDLTRIRVKMGGKELDLKQLLLYAWNNQQIPQEAGKHKIDFNAVTIIDTQDPKYKQYCELYFNVEVAEKYYLRIFPANFLKSIKDSNNKYFLDIPLFADPEKLNEEWEQFETLKEMNKAACIDGQPEDIKNLFIKPFYSLNIDEAKFEIN